MFVAVVVPVSVSRPVRGLGARSSPSCVSSRATESTLGGRCDSRTYGRRNGLFGRNPRCLFAARGGLVNVGQTGRRVNGSSLADGGPISASFVIPFFAFSPLIRKAIYTTNAIESLNATVRRAVRARGHFTSVGAAKKLMYLALREASAKWNAPMLHWQSFKREFAIHFEGRFNPSKGGLEI